MKKIVPVLFVCCFVLSNSSGQATQHYNNYLQINPAYAGVKKKHHLGMLYKHVTRSNNFKFKDHDLLANYDFFSTKARSGFGFYYNITNFAQHTEYYRSYLYRTHTVNFTYSVHIKIKEHRIIPGIGFNFQRKLYDRLIFDNDLLPPGIEPFPLPYTSNQFLLDVGIWYLFQRLNVGFSVKNVIRVPKNSLLDGLTYQDYRNYNLMINYSHVISAILRLNPYTLIKITPIKGDKYTTLLVGLNSEFKSIFILGVNYRYKTRDNIPEHSISPTLAVKIKNTVLMSFTFNFWLPRSNPFDNLPIDVESGINAEF